MSLYEMIRTGINLDLSFLFDFYESSLAHFDGSLKTIEARWDKIERDDDVEYVSHQTEHLSDQQYMVARSQQHCSYAVAILLGSLTEDWLDMIERRLERDAPVARARYEAEKQTVKGRTKLRVYMDFHKTEFGVDLLSGVEAAPKRWVDDAFLPDGLVEQPSTVDGRFVEDFIWARNKIVHKRGRARATQLRRGDGAARNVPVNGLDGDEERAPENFQIEMPREYIYGVTRALVAFFHRIVFDLSSRYEAHAEAGSQ
ncbi:MAG: hypothetical protein M3P30_11170 [Chloroflexota bacterium]|nr:hypothetical protein [Chloroflexota bacterium]